MNVPIKKLLFVFLSLFLHVHGTGQQRNKEGPQYARVEMSPFYLSLDIRKKDRIPSSNFNRIVVSDARPDTSMMGEVTIESKSGPKKIAFPENATAYLNEKLNKAVITGAPPNILYIRLNDLWFNQTVTQAGWLEGVVMGNEKLVSTCFFNADIFISGENKIIKIGNLDTSFIKKGWLPNNCDELLGKAFQTAIALVAQLDIASAAKYLPAVPMDSITNAGFLPLVLQKERLLKGIYFSYQDFLNNRPVELPFEVEDKGGKYLLTYTLPAADSADKAWGYCDGGYIYMHLDKWYYPLSKKNNSFTVLAPETIEIINTFISKVVSGSIWYFTYENPFKIFAIEPFLDPRVKRQITLRRYYLNILNGTLR